MIGKWSSLLLASLFVLPAFSAEKFVCNEYDPNTNLYTASGRTVVLTPKGPGRKTSDGATITPYWISVYKHAELWTQDSFEGEAWNKETAFEFNSNDRQVAIFIRLDEIHWSTLNMNGKTVGRYICR